MEDWTKKWKVIKNEPTMSIRKHANKLKVYKKTVRTAIKQDLSSDLNSLAYTIWAVLKNKTNTTSHPNFSLLKIAIEEGWNKMSEELILKACWYNNWKKTVVILSKFTILCLSSYLVVYFLYLELILFHYRVVYYYYYYTRIFLILLLHPI